MRVMDLNNTQLDFWVAKAEGIEVKYSSSGEFWRVIGVEGVIQWLPHRDWAQGGPIIEREGIGFFRAPTPGNPEYGEKLWVASDAQDKYTQRGKNPLIAAMRVYVTSKFGEDLPDQ